MFNLLTGGFALKKSYITTAIVAFIAVLLTTVFVIVKNNLPGQNPSVTDGNGDKVDETEYEAAVDFSSETASPLLKTDIAGVYYTITTDGVVKFYTLSESGLTEVEASGKKEIKVTVSNESLKATVYYLRKDGVLNGFGLFTANMDANVQIYEYAFFKVINVPVISSVPAAYKKNSSALLLIDTDKEDFYNNNKVYEEQFLVDLESGISKSYLYIMNRAIDDRGAGRADYAMLTDEVIKDKSGSSILFFSARHYHLYDTAKTLDIFKSGGSGNNTDNNRYVKDILGMYAKNSDKGVIFLAHNADKTAVEVRRYDGKNIEKLYEFPGKYDSFIRSGDYLINTQNNTLYSIITGKSFSLNISDSGFKAEIGFISADGKSVFLRGKTSSAPAIVLSEMNEDGSFASRIYYNGSFKYLTALDITADGKYLCTVSETAEGGKYTLYLFK